MPGALALFAKANKITLAELDKLLDQGKVTTKQFVDFLKKLGTDYELQAQLIGNSAEEAGARFGVAMEELKFKAGTTLIPVGAAFQDLATQITRAIIPLTEEGGAIQNLADAIRGLQIVAKETGPIVGDIFRGMAKEINAAFEILNPSAAGAVNGLLAYFAQIGKEARDLEERYKELNANKRTVTYATADQVTRENGGYITQEAKRVGEEMAKQVALAAKLEPFLIQKTNLEKELALAVGEQNEALRDELNYKIRSVELAIRQFKALEGITDEKRRQQIIDDFARQQSVLLAKLTGQRLEDEEDITKELEKQFQIVADQIDKQAAAEAKAEAERQKFEDDAGKSIKDKIALQQAVLAGKEDEYKRQKMIDDLIESSTKDGVTYIGPEEAGRLVDTFLQGEKAVAQYNKQLEMTKQLGLDLKNALDTAIVDTITAAIDGSKDLNAVLSDTLKQVGRLLLNFGVKTLTGGILGFKDGGVAPAGQASVVGENGPELIRPLVPTMVSPFDENRESLATQATKAIASDAFGEASEVMGQSTAVMATNSARSESKEFTSASSMTIETQVINSVEYATVDQVQAAAKAASKEARARVFSDLKNKPTARAGVGV